MGSGRFKLVLLLQLVLVLMQLVESGSIVKYLPGFEGPLPFELETGYIGVGEAEDEQMFYYFIKSDSNPVQDPLLIWLTGGPDCSSFSGLVCENGPLAFKIEAYNGSLPTLVATTYSWTKVANIIYLDQPVGTGFSYSRKPLNYIISDSGMVKRVDEFVRKWLDKHPEYFSNDFYVTGNSYSGKVIPAIVQEISNGNSMSRKPQINLQGYVLGNPVTNIDLDKNFRIQFAHNMGLIPEELYESMKRICGGQYVHVDPLNTECLKLVKEYEKCVSGINQDLILIPKCEKTSLNCFTYAHLLTEYWANDQSVRKALKVVEVYDKLKIGDDEDMMVVPSIATQDWINHSSIEKLRPWTRCSSLPHNKDIKSSIPHHKDNSIKGRYRSLIISGDHDMLVPPLATLSWIKSLNYSITEEWRPWLIDNQVAGYTRTYANNMTFATVKGGGHTLDLKPEESSTVFKRWITNQPL